MSDVRAKRWALVTGAKGQPSRMGAVVEALTAAGLRLAGFLQERHGAGGEGRHTLLRLGGQGTPKRHALARESATADQGELAFCSYAFSADAFALARQWVEEDLPRAEVVVIDGVSKLEAGGGGHALALAHALASDRLVVLRVREDQLFAVVERFALDDAVASLNDESPGALGAFVEAVVAQARQGQVRAGDLDWASHWRGRVLAHRSGVPGSEDAWAGRAGRFAKVAGELSAEPLFSLLGPLLRPDDVVADLGAGVGRHVVELARRTAQVVAVEPSPAMRALLAQRVAAEGLANVTVVAQGWPTPLPVAVDVAFSSHVLYAVEDAAAFLGAMSRAARRLCLVLLGVRPPSSALEGLWRAVRGSPPRPRLPGALEALNLLWQLGAPAELQLVPGSERALVFGDDPEDLVELCHRLHLPPDEEGRRAVRDGLARVAARTPDGRWGVGVTGPNALLVWRPSPQAPR